MERRSWPRIVTNIPLLLNCRDSMYDCIVEEFSFRGALVMVIDKRVPTSIQDRDEVSFRLVSAEMFSEYHGIVVRRSRGKPLRLVIAFTASCVNDTKKPSRDIHPKAS